MKDLDELIKEAEKKERELVSVLRSHQEYMDSLYKERRWWTRFLHYCRTGK
jgi:hypothetical protein